MPGFSSPNSPSGKPDETTADEPLQPARRLNIFYRLTIIPVAALIFTVLGLVAVLMGGQPAAPLPRWLLRYWGPLVTTEVVLSLLFGLLALAVDRRRQWEQRATRPDFLPAAEEQRRQGPEPENEQQVREESAL